MSVIVVFVFRITIHPTFLPVLYLTKNRYFFQDKLKIPKNKKLWRFSKIHHMIDDVYEPKLVINSTTVYVVLRENNYF